ncbi:hypothetical protein [Agaribacter marinus]|uniref:Uncharacterized protein n=1 Tax=Agaribacter marinus TaxID=1431249 RepID=A0AA37SX49_9ALTE|nr:hypothetical protein [Agaribacter marinus]GLR71292.1 hypothetical protein GCM10007852_22000 [Agaribacter marinus]
MNKFKLAALVTATLVSSASFAASETFDANVTAAADASIANSTAIDFGTVQVASGSVCTMDDAGAVTGACDASAAEIALGQVDVTGLLPNTGVTVELTFSAGTNVTFVPSFDINNAAAASDGHASADGAISVTTDGSGSDLLIDVYGQLTVNNTLTPGADETAPYTVEVLFQ